MKMEQYSKIKKKTGNYTRKRKWGIIKKEENN